MTIEVPAAENALCTPKNVRDYVAGRVDAGGDVTDASDDILQKYINEFSERFEGEHWANRLLAIKERTQYYDGGDPSVFLNATPILLTSDDPPVPDLTVWEDKGRTFAATSQLTWNTGYTINLKNGILRRVESTDLCPKDWATGQMVVKVTYTGGLMYPTDSTIVSGGYVPYELHNAAIRQVAAWWQMRKNPDASAASWGGGPALQFVTAPDGTRLLTDVWHYIWSKRREF